MNPTTKPARTIRKQEKPDDNELFNPRPTLTCECAWWGKPAPLFFWDDEPTDEVTESSVVTSR